MSIHPRDGHLDGAAWRAQFQEATMLHTSLSSSERSDYHDYSYKYKNKNTDCSFVGNLSGGGLSMPVYLNIITAVCNILIAPL